MTNGALVNKNAMRLRNRIIPQAGTDVNIVGESRPEPSGLALVGSGCPMFSGEGTVSHQSALDRQVPSEQYTKPNRSPSPSSITVSERSLFSNIPSPSSTHSLYRSPNSSPSSTVSSRITRSTAVVQEAQATNPVSTAGPHRARKKWTENMNRFIWRTYLLITQCETTLLNNYLEPLHQHFINTYPEMQATRQRIGDQRRAIIRRQLLPKHILDEIDIEVREHLQAVTNRLSPTRTFSPPAVLTPYLSQTNTHNNTRMKWSDEINEDIVRCYFEVTELGTNKTAYRKKMYDLFIEKHPHLSHTTEQRIADQRRLIFNNKKYVNKIRELKREIELKFSLQDIHIHTQIEHQSNRQHENTGTTVTQTQTNIKSQADVILPTLLPQTLTSSSTITENNITQISNNDEEQSKIEIEFNNKITQFRDSDPETRPYIPKQKSSRRLAQIIQYLNNVVLPKHLNHDLNFTQLHTIIYVAAFTTAVCNGTKFNLSQNTNTNNRNKKPTWQIRMEKRISRYRQEIGRLTQYIAGNRNRRILKTVEEIKRKYKIHSQYEEPNTEPQEFLDTLKQKLNAISNRLKRYLNCTKRKQQNSLFSNNERQFYRTLGSNKQENIKKSPSAEALHQFWSNIWESPKQHNINAGWLHKTANTEHINPMGFENIPICTLIQTIKRTHNWKAPGTDNIHNFWYKKFSCTHPFIHKHICQFIQTPHTIPSFIMQGITYMIPKDFSDLENPANYRPITCLQTIYKIITGCITDITYQHIDKYNILTEQQKGCRKLSQGCKEQLTIDAIVMRQAQTRNRNIHTMYIDYKKAFDSVPHSWLIHVLDHYKIHPSITTFLDTVMNQWKTKLKLVHSNTETTTGLIKIQKGIFQGDALSPLWFCLALNPLSEILNDSNIGFKLKYNNSYYILSHLMYMDDIKIYAANKVELSKLVDITQLFSTDIHMQFGVDKCKIHSIHRGKSQYNAYMLDTGEQITSMDEYSSYKYLGFRQAKQIQQKDTKLELIKRFKFRLNQILRTQLNSRNTIKAINTYAIPVLTYSFGIISWSQTDIAKLQRTINTHMTAHRKHHPRSCTQRLTLPRRDGGRGLIDIQNLHNNIITKLRKYFHDKAEHSQLHSYVIQIDSKLTSLNLGNRSFQLTSSSRQQKIDLWSQKALHGRHLADLNQAHVDKQASNEWLQQGELFPETEAFMIAIQDQIIDTRNYQKHITHIPNVTTDLCRHCKSNSETIQHITGACKSIVQTDYKHRHDQVAAIIHQNLAYKHLFISKKEAYYKYKPSVVLENTLIKIYWDRTIITDKTIHCNRPDITILDKLNKIVYIIDVAVCNTHNLQTTYTDKLTKYKDLASEIKHQWQIDLVKIVPIVISTTGVIPTSLQANLKTLHMPRSTRPLLQKAVILNTCRLTRKFLSESSSST